MEHVAIPAPGSTIAASGDVARLISSKALRGLLAHWVVRRGDRAIPARDDLAEDRLTNALDDLVLFEIACEGSEQYQTNMLAAASLVSGMGTPYREAMLCGQPIYCRCHSSKGFAVERLLLPLSRDGVGVETILVGIERGHWQRRSID